jgi:hypothetical protein
MTSFFKTTNKNTISSMSQMWPYKNKCETGTQGVCKDSFTHGTSKYVHHLTSGCPTEVHKLCMEELVDYDNNDYVAVVMKPDKNEHPLVFWRRVKVEINTQMNLYKKTDPHLTPNIPAIVIVNGNIPSIIVSFDTLDTIRPPNYAVLIMERIQKADVAFDIDNFTTRLVDLGIFWWDFKPENTGYLRKDGDTNQVMIDCDNDFIYFFNDGDKKNEKLKQSCKIFMMLEYSIFHGMGKQLPYTLPDILAAIEYIDTFEDGIISGKDKLKDNGQTPINTLRFYMSFYMNYYTEPTKPTKPNKPSENPLTYLLRTIPLYFQFKKEGGYRKRRRTTRKRYRRRSKTKKATEGSLRSRSS